MKMSKKINTLLRILKFEKETLEGRIARLIKEKGEVTEKIKKIKLETMVVDLNQEKEELEERIEKLEREREDVVRDMKVVGFMGELKCPKDYQCYKKRYEELCKTEFFGETKILHCLEEEPQSCTFSLSYQDTYYCQCPLRNFIAEEIGK
jgi:hypothetical protein